MSNACDAGSRDEQPAHGPALHLVASYPADGQGTNADGDAGVDCDTPTPDCPVPTNVAIELRFDRFLLPGAGLGAGLRLFTGSEANGVGLSVRQYDVVERVVVFDVTSPLQPNTIYTAEITPGKDPTQGFWAFDRAPIEDGPVPLRFSFTTGSGPATPATTTLHTDNCITLTKDLEVVGAMQLQLPAGPLNLCSTASCHANPPSPPPTNAGDWVAGFPPMGLSLSDWGLRHTAIQHVAHESETGNSALGPGFESPPPRFGVQMNIVDPGAPENSYLMYKLLRKPENYALDAKEACPTSFHSPVQDGACQAPDVEELARLREWFVLGDPMPKDSGSGVASISRDGLVRVANWIRDGAACDVP